MLIVRIGIMERKHYDRWMRNKCCMRLVRVVSMSVSRDQAAFQLSGGKLKMGTNDVILKCTVNTIPADRLGVRDSRGFQWHKYMSHGVRFLAYFKFVSVSGAP